MCSGMKITKPRDNFPGDCFKHFFSYFKKANFDVIVQAFIVLKKRRDCVLPQSFPFRERKIGGLSGK